MGRPNDIGGSRAKAGPVDANAGAPADWHKALTALVNALGPAGRAHLRIDEFRRAREDIPQEVYDTLDYFELWTQGLANLLVEKGLIAGEEIDRRMRDLRNGIG